MAPLPHAIRRERIRNLLFLSTPRLWPVWPFLPLLRRRPGYEDECGLLYDVFGLRGMPGYKAAVFACNIFELPPEEQLLEMPRETFDTPEEIYSSGWRIE